MKTCTNCKKKIEDGAFKDAEGDEYCMDCAAKLGMEMEDYEY